MYREDAIKSIAIALSTKCSYLDLDVSHIIAEKYILLRKEQGINDAKYYHLNREWSQYVTPLKIRGGFTFIPTTLNLMPRFSSKLLWSYRIKLKEYEGVFKFMSSKRGIRGIPYWNVSSGIWGIENHLSTDKISMKEKLDDLSKIPIHIIRSPDNLWRNADH